MKIGVVLFDEPAHHTTGWAQAVGSQPEIIGSTADLSTETTWWTNLDYPDFGRSGLARSPRFRGARFFRSSMRGLLKDAGLDGAAPQDQLAYLVHLLDTSLELGQVLGLRVVPPNTLASGLHEVYVPKSCEWMPRTQEQEAVKQATQPFTFCETPAWRKGDRVLSLRRAPVAHCSEILGAHVPIGPFERVGIETLPTDIAELVAYEKPVLVQVRINRFDERLSGLINYGAGAGTLRRTAGTGHYSEANQRLWVTQPELGLVAHHADLHILDALVGQRYEPNGVSLPHMTARHHLSTAWGLVCESLWSGLMRTTTGQLRYTAQAAWVAALDRVICLTGALDILRLFPDAIVQHYGGGRVTIRVQDDGRYLNERLYYALMETDWLAPMIPEQVQPTFPVPSRPQATELLRVMAMRGRRDSMMAMDNTLTAFLREVRQRQPEAYHYG